MAIEINREKNLSAPLWMTFLLAAAGIAAVILIGSYIYFLIANGSMVKKMNELDDSTADLNKEVVQKESELILVQKKINDFKDLVSSHKNLADVFSFLEKNIIPSIRFDKFDFNGGNGAVLVDGTAPNMIAVDQQLDIFKKGEEVKKIILSDVSLNEDGETKFGFQITFEPEVFLFNEEQE